MALRKISELTAAAALDGTELVEVVQAGNSRRTTAGGLLTYPITAAETAASVTPVDFRYPEGHVLRYGTNTTPGTTDMTTAIQNAIDVMEQKGGGNAFVPNGDYLFSILTIEAHGVGLIGEDPVGTTLTSSSTDTTAITVANNSCRLENFVLDATSARSAVSSTAYSDSTPSDGVHGIAYIPSNTSTTQFRGVVRHVTVKNQPDDGFFFQQPEFLFTEQIEANGNGRIGVHLNGQENNRGIANTLINTRAISNGDKGIYIRTIKHSTLISPEALSNSGTIQLDIHGGDDNTIIVPDVEDSAFNSNIGIRIVGNRHRMLGGFIFKFKTPIQLSATDFCVIDRPLVNNAGVTAADQVVQIAGQSCDHNVLRIGPLTAHTNVTALVNNPTGWPGAVGNVIEPYLATTFTFAANDATPAVGAGRGPYVTNNNSATTITDFDSGVAGQIILVQIGDGNTTFDFTGGILIGNGGADWTASSGDTLLAYYDGTNWYCFINAATTQTYTPTNVTTDRAFDADTVAVSELADVVGTLIADLQARGVIG